MDQNPYFNQALSNFTFDMACGGKIRHLADRGYTVKQIMESLDYPAPYEKVRQAVWERLLEQQILLLEEPGKQPPKTQTVYMEERGKFGKTSFRRVAAPMEGSRQIDWKEMKYGEKEVETLIRTLSEKCGDFKDKTAYVSCDYGIIMKKDLKRFAAMLDTLEYRQKEYIEGLPWVNQIVYHRMDQRMLEIICRLCLHGQFSGSCYFMESEERIVCISSQTK